MEYHGHERLLRASSSDGIAEGTGNSMAEDLIRAVERVARAGLCMGCGTCEAACPEEAVRIEFDPDRGTYIPRVDGTKCSDCGFCLRTCPGQEVLFSNLEERFLECAEHNPRLGHYDQCFTGYSLDPDIRAHCTSGGIATVLLLYALRTRLIDGALVLKARHDVPLSAFPSIATTSEEIIAAAGSKYFPSAINRSLRSLLSQDDTRRIAVVGLPCHIHGVRKLEQHLPILSERVVLRLGLFCANCPTCLGTEYFLWLRGIPSSDVRAVEYRAGGWPGVLRVTLKDGEKLDLPRGTTERSVRRKAEFYSAFHYDFSMPRCLICPDQTNELADISLGDLWHPAARAEESAGHSFVISRTSIGSELLRRAVDAGEVLLRELPLRDACSAQNYGFKERVGARLYWRGLMRRPIPDYGDRDLSCRRGRLLALRYCPSYVSHHRALWPAIRIFAVLYSLSWHVGKEVYRLTRRLLQRPARRKPRPDDVE